VAPKNICGVLLSPRVSDLCNKVAECPTANSEQNFHKLGGDRTTSAPWGREGRSFERLLAAKVNLAGFLQRLRACCRVPHFQLFWSEAYTLGTISVGRCFLLGRILAQWSVHWCAPCRENHKVARQSSAAYCDRSPSTRLPRVDASLERVRLARKNRQTPLRAHQHLFACFPRTLTC